MNDGAPPRPDPKAVRTSLVDSGWSAPPPAADEATEVLDVPPARPLPSYDAPEAPGRDVTMVDREVHSRAKAMREKDTLPPPRRSGFPPSRSSGFPPSRASAFPPAPPPPPVVRAAEPPVVIHPGEAASLMVFQDGQAFKDMDGVVRAPNVLDNLIYRREIPVMIAVFINPGRRPDQPEPTPQNWGDRDTNRPAEYNTLDDKYARVIVDELLPALYKDYNISKDPERHGIGGSSSGAIAAFTVAGERPDHFRKVLSNVGSFVNLRGGHVYPEIVRKSEKKPLRVFLVDGRNDNRGLRGDDYDQSRDWFYQNVRLMQALTEKGYDVNYSWGIGRHGQKQGGAILPEMMRWLWRDHPVSVDVNDMVERSFNKPPEKKGPGLD